MTFEDEAPTRSAPGSSSQSRAASRSASRPQLHSSNTMPMQSSYSTTSPRHNAWLDEDEEFGKENEMSMTFE